MRLAASLTILVCMRCFAQTNEDDSAALSLADQVEATDQKTHDWRGALEAAGVQAAQNYGLPSVHGERLSSDGRYDGALAAGVRGVVSDRLDVNWLAGAAATEVNTLREAYVSGRTDAGLLDVGRVNVRSGVALGYNPTDFLRSDAVREIDSLDPDSLRANRLGAVMVRAQTLWSTGSVTALVSPRLADKPSDGPFSLDLGATNRQNRWSLGVSQRLTPDFNPQVLIYGDAQGGVKAGLNMTYLVNPATIAYVEWSGGRGPSVLSQSSVSSPSSVGHDAEIFASRLAAGLTYTTPWRLSVTLEYEENSAALDRTQWDELRYGPAAAFSALPSIRVGPAGPADAPRAVHVLADSRLGLAAFRCASAFSRVDLEDHSRIDWIEARYHWPKIDLALQVQHDAGGIETAFGAAPQRRVVQLLLDYYFP